MIGYLILRPGIDEMTEIQERIGQYEAILLRHERQTKNEQAIQRSLEEQLKRYADVKSTYFCAEEANDFIVNRLPELAQRYRISLPSIGVKPMENFNNRVQLLPVDMQLSGEYFYLKEFIAGLENYKKAIIVSDFNMSVQRQVVNGKDVSTIATQLTIRLAVLSDGD